MTGSVNHSVGRRRVFYIPGYDPIHPRRYRELYRKEGAAQADISGYDLALSPKAADGQGRYGWNVRAQMDQRQIETQFEVLVWSDIVRDSMEQGILATYLQLLRTAWAYIASGALSRLMRLRKGPVIAALYPVVFLLLQLALALLAAYGLGHLIAMVAPGWAGVLGLVIVPFVLAAFRRWDNKLFAYYLMHDYAYLARWNGANPPELEARMAEFTNEIAAALRDPMDEVLIVGHSSGAIGRASCRERVCQYV